ncbi:hypothetical protein AGMMS4956_04230 [Bacteroidia bacterium]|nr:hypothetical protein AGMMS4956_04230 [Bacteroidia bacterium]
MKLFAVTGNPILHSKSPLLFQSAYPQSENEFCYFRLHAETAKEALQTFTELGLSGMNVTAPFKSDILPFATTHTPTAKTLNACNTLLLTKNGIIAENTDVNGVLGALSGAGIPIKNTQCLVLGAGGAGVAAAFALHNAGAQVVLANRTTHKAQAIAEHIGCAHCALDGLLQALQRATVIVNTIHPDVIDPKLLTAQHTVLDAIYPHPSLQKMAESKCSTYIDGMQWLLYQGFAAYHLFTKKEPNMAAMQNFAAQPVAAMPRHISLIGFMGVGKTTVGQVLAQKMKMPFVDTDAVIEQDCNDTIPHIIAQKGEAEFRKIEQEVVSKILEQSTPSVISCGGGVVTTPALGNLLHQKSIAVWLYAPLEQCLQNIADIASRPLLMQSDDPQTTAQKLFEQRKQMYAQTSWMLVNTKEKTTQQIVQIVYDEIDKLFAH